MHPDPDLLALVALGEPAATEKELAHIAECPACASELDALSAAVRAGRSTASAPPLVQPDERVWRQISASLALGSRDNPRVSGASEVRGGPEVLGASEVRGGPEVLAAPVTDAPDAASGPTRRDVRSRGRLSRPARWLALAAAIVLAATAGGVVTALALGRGSGGGGTSGTPTVIAQAVLQALPDWPGAGGDATVEESGDARVMTVSVTADTERPATYREVWLLNASLTKLVSLGLLSSNTASFAIPADIDMSEYTIVDVSSEPLDGNPAHSANSIVRGTLGS